MSGRSRGIRSRLSKVLGKREWRAAVRRCCRDRRG
jgi:hypothetical protein